MNIIFGTENAEQLRKKYTVLELDTFFVKELNQTATAYCIVQHIPLGELSQVENMQQLHNDLIRCYGQKEWIACNHAIENLMGFWNSELDSFYIDLLDRVNRYQASDLDAGWTPIIEK
jgi:hypothetical protein